MPEGPEIRAFSGYLDEICKGRALKEIGWNPKSKSFRKEKTQLDYQKLAQILPLKISYVSPRGKCIIFVLEGGVFLTSTLLMAGKWTLEKQNHSDIWLVLESDQGDQYVYYDDARHFGNFNIYHSAKDLNKYLMNIGPDLLNNPPPWEDFLDRFKKLIRRIPNMNIFAFLHQQKYFSGPGNYVINEALGYSKISPHRKVSQLSDDEIFDLYYYLQYIMINSYLMGGLTIQSYQNPKGGSGKFETFIYRHPELVVSNSDGTISSYEVITELMSNKRTAHWAPGYQV